MAFGFHGTRFVRTCGCRLMRHTPGQLDKVIADCLSFTLSEKALQSVRTAMAQPMEQSIHRDPALLYVALSLRNTEANRSNQLLDPISYHDCHGSTFPPPVERRTYKLNVPIRSSPVSSATTRPSSSPAPQRSSNFRPFANNVPSSVESISGTTPTPSPPLPSPPARTT